MSDYINVAEIFGQNVFNDTVMQERLPKKIYKELKRTIEEGAELDLEFAASNTAVPYHPGAAAYFAEKGIEVPTK